MQDVYTNDYYDDMMMILIIIGMKIIICFKSLDITFFCLKAKVLCVFCIIIPINPFTP